MCSVLLYHNMKIFVAFTLVNFLQDQPLNCAVSVNVENSLFCPLKTGPRLRTGTLRLKGSADTGCVLQTLVCSVLSVSLSLSHVHTDCSWHVADRVTLYARIQVLMGSNLGPFLLTSYFTVFHPKLLQKTGIALFFGHFAPCYYLEVEYA